jgi:hypothetical protein
VILIVTGIGGRPLASVIKPEVVEGVDALAPVTLHTSQGPSVGTDLDLPAFLRRRMASA